MMDLWLYKIVDTIFFVLYMALFIRVILSWLPHDTDHPIVDYLYRFTDPMLKPFQDILPTWKMGIDLSPLFAFFALKLLKTLVYMLL